MKFGKRQLILASLVLALGAAVYLNWVFSSGKLQTTQVLSVSSQYGDTQLVITDTVYPTDGDVSQTAAQIHGERAESLSQARLNRQKAREEAVAMLEKLVNEENTDEQTRAQAIEQAAQIAQNVVRETNIENVLQAKGFTDCMAYLENGACTVVISGEIKDAGEALILQDVICSQTGLPTENIKIVPIK